MQQLGPHSKLIQYHCIIYQQNLIGNALGLKQIMADVVSAVNFIRSHRLNHRQLKVFFDKIKSEHGDIVYYSEV
jgi:hypothetical protein